MKTKKKAAKERAYLELDGTISLVEVKGNKTTRNTIDGKLVLELLLSVIRDSLRNQNNA